MTFGFGKVSSQTKLGSSELYPSRKVLTLWVEHPWVIEFGTDSPVKLEII